MKIRQITAVLETIAPPHLAADWDNVGLLIGDRRRDVTAMMLCIDLTDDVLAEAVRAKAKMIMAYHPVLFKPVRRLTAADSSAAYAAAAGGMAVYSMHTALDVAAGGTNDVLAEVLGLKDPAPLEPTVRPGGCKVVVFTPPDDLSRIADAAFDAGAGKIGNYERCAFFTHGIGTFTGTPASRPTTGQAGRQAAVEELRFEMVVPADRVAAVCSAIRRAHSYEAPAIDIYPIEDAPRSIGMGRIGPLARPVTTAALIRRVKKRSGMKKVLLATADGGPQRAGRRAALQAGRSGMKKVMLATADGGTRAGRRVALQAGRSDMKKVLPATSDGGQRRAGAGLGRLVSVAACAAGSCGSTYKSAIAGGATFYLTGEMRHHDALAATAAGLDVVCLGHWNSERITLNRLADRIKSELPKLRVLVAKTDRAPFVIA